MAVIARRRVSQFTEGLKSKDPNVSLQAARNIIQECKDSGQSLINFIRLAVDTRAEEDKGVFTGYNGFEAVLMDLGIPLQPDLDSGVVMQMAGDTFITHPGSRLLFPEVIDQVLRLKTRVNNVENTASIVGNSRTISGAEFITTYFDPSANGADQTFIIPELGEIPMTKITTEQNTVAMYKHGSGYEFSYEFDRRAQLDIITPFAARIARKLEISKVAALTYMLINGDGVNPAATGYNLSTYGGDFTGGKTLKDNYRALAKFLMTLAQSSYSFDKLICNFDTYIELMFMFAPTSSGAASVADYMAQKRGMIDVAPLDLLGGRVQVALSSTVPANKIICEIQAECAEELVEANSNISESERAITNQKIMYTRTENTGYKLVHPDARVLLDVAN